MYRWLLRLYPASFRNEYGDEMRAVFEWSSSSIFTDSRPPKSQEKGRREHWFGLLFEN